MREGKVRLSWPRMTPVGLVPALLTVCLLSGCARESVTKKAVFDSAPGPIHAKNTGASGYVPHARMDTKSRGEEEPRFPGPRVEMPAVPEPKPEPTPGVPPGRPRENPGGTGAPPETRVAGLGGTIADRLERDRLASDKGQPRQDKPQVWKRDARQPTFARVYVGDNNSLELVSLHVTVTVEGPRARTLVDHVFRNPHDRQLEGTFEYPLPTGAAPSHFAMFLGATRDAVPPRFAPRGATPPLPADALARLSPAEVVKQISTADWGRLQEARVVSQAKALEVYEETVRGRIDPALLEYAGGNTFRGRVFPIAPRGYNRVLIAYEELLPVGGDRVVYRYPLPDCKLTELQLTLQAREQDFREATFRPDAKRDEGGGQVLYRRTWTDEGPGGEAVFTYVPTLPEVQAISGTHGGNERYLYARVRPELKAEAEKPFADRGVFLLDTSHSEHPDRFAVSMRLLRRVLEGDADLKEFNVLLFNTTATWLEPQGWLPNTAEGREKVFKLLDGLVLEGATDLSAALDVLADSGPEVKAGTPLNVFLLSDGQVTWGESSVPTLVSRFENRCRHLTRFHCYRTGLGAENQELFDALTRRGGGVFNCFGDADLAAAAVAHRRQCFQVERVNLVGGPAASDVLVAGGRSAVYPGGEVIVTARMASAGKTALRLEGTFLGKPHTVDIPLDASGNSELAGRGWAEVAVASLLALNDPTLDELVTAYCQQFGVASRVASLLVLENEADYKRLDLEKERGKTLAGDLGAFLSARWQQLGRPVPAKEAFVRLLGRAAPRLDPNSEPLRTLLGLLTDKDFELPEVKLAGSILHRGDVPPTYLTERQADRAKVETYLNEAKRRAVAGDAVGAARVLSTVVEEHPGRGDALRLVGYRLLDLKQPAHAARLFAQVEQSRPFEPQSYRDLARSLEDVGRYGLAAVQYEAVLAGNWDVRFRGAAQTVAREEYARMLREALTRKAVGGALAQQFQQRLSALAFSDTPADLRVTMSWNSDNTDVDLWVVEPDAFKCYYGVPRSPSGGELSQDLTQGYGPERYQVRKALRGTYRVRVHYFARNPNLLGGETHVSVVVTKFSGTPRETTERHTVILRKHGEEAEVCRVEF